LTISTGSAGTRIGAAYIFTPSAGPWPRPARASRAIPAASSFLRLPDATVHPELVKNRRGAGLGLGWNSIVTVLRHHATCKG